MSFSLKFLLCFVAYAAKFSNHSPKMTIDGNPEAEIVVGYLEFEQ